MIKKFIIGLFVILIIGSVLVFLQQLSIVQKAKMGKNKKIVKTADNLGIENYIVTRITANQAAIRVYGINKGATKVNHFPIIIQYYSKKGKYLGKDEVDLLKISGNSLKPYGKFNSQIDITYPRTAQRITVRIKL